MNKTIVNQPIPLDVASQLCAEIRAEAEENWHTASARWCWHCRRTYEGRKNFKGFRQKPGNRGCILVNARYASMLRSSPNAA